MRHDSVCMWQSMRADACQLADNARHCPCNGRLLAGCEQHGHHNQQRRHCCGLLRRQATGACKFALDIHTLLRPCLAQAPNALKTGYETIFLQTSELLPSGLLIAVVLGAALAVCLVVNGIWLRSGASASCHVASTHGASGAKQHSWLMQ